MGLEKLIPNLEILIRTVHSLKKTPNDVFIKSCELYSAPSIEKFLIDVTRFIPNENEKDEIGNVDEENKQE
jgi:hypothetical protein